MDNDDEPDIATSDRQRLQEDDPRYVALVKFLKESVNTLEKQWNDWRRKHEVKKAKEMAPALGQWLSGLPEGHRKSAEAMIANLSAVQVDDDADRRVLYRHGILAFERMKIRGFADELATGIVDIESLLPILADRDALEASLYRDIVRSRLDAIKAFQSLVDEDARERALQEHLFDQLWLLDPAWERAAGSEIMESRLKAEGVIVEDLTEKEKLGRVDIAYRTTAGKHIIVELKRAGRKMKLLELVGQGQTYVDKTRKILAAQGMGSPNIEVIFVLGRPVDEETSDPERLKASMASISSGSRIVHYDTLIRGAQEAYAEYLTVSAKLDKLEKIVDQI